MQGKTDELLSSRGWDQSGSAPCPHARAQPVALVALQGFRSKTTLLNLLSRRTEATAGEILFNGKKPTYQLQRVQGFVEQEGEPGHPMQPLTLAPRVALHLRQLCSL